MNNKEFIIIIIIIIITTGGRYSVVGIVTRCGLNGPGSNPGRSEIYRTRRDRPWDPASLLWNGCRVSLTGVKRPGRGDDHQTTSSAEVKERVELYRYFPLGHLRQVIGWTDLNNNNNNNNNIIIIIIHYIYRCRLQTKFFPWLVGVVFLYFWILSIHRMDNTSNKEMSKWLLFSSVLKTAVSVARLANYRIWSRSGTVITAGCVLFRPLVLSDFRKLFSLQFGTDPCLKHLNY
jgi:hypothetical protein